MTLEEAVAYLKEQDLAAMEVGTYEVDTVNVAGLIVEEAYDADRDVAFWQEPAEMCHMVLSSGSYAILPPSIAHKPGMRAGSQASPVKKCVGKVRVH